MQCANQNGAGGNKIFGVRLNAPLSWKSHRLGNLTLSGYNANLGKMEFQRKRDRRSERGDFLGYRNGLYLNRELASRDDWNEAAISDRTKTIAEEVRTLFALDGPASSSTPST
jgi:hypothetical protein